MTWHGVSGHGPARQAGLGRARQGMAGHGSARQSRLGGFGVAGHGMARHGRRVMAGQGSSRCGKARLGRHGSSGLGRARPGVAGRGKAGRKTFSSEARSRRYGRGPRTQPELKRGAGIVHDNDKTPRAGIAAGRHSADLDHDLADALHDTHSSFIEVNAVEHVDGEPTRYVVMFSHRYSVAASSPVDALAAAVTGLRAAMGGAA